MKAISASMIFCASIVLSQAHAAAETWRVALLIGNWDYDMSGAWEEAPRQNFQADLKNPCKDVNRVKQSLERVQFGNDIEVACNLSLQGFKRKLDDFARKVENLPPGSLAFIFYSGHGLQQYGYIWSLPVLMELPGELLQDGRENQQIQHLSKEAIEIQAALRKFTNRTDIAIYIALDQCRNAPLPSKIAFNNGFNPAIPENVGIQFSSTPGETSPDGSEMVKLLTTELERGGKMTDIAGRVYGKSLDLFRNKGKGSYSVNYAGRDFQRLKSPAMSLQAAPNTTPPPPTLLQAADDVVRGRQELRQKPAGAKPPPSLDIFWCEGKGERARYSTAMDLARKIAKDAPAYGVGRVAVRSLPVQANLHDYNVWRNLMRYDPGEDNEKFILESIASKFSEYAFLPQRGTGFGNKPTYNYMSAFICEGFTGQ
ncbi:caspase family protein [Achromobacter anxifer]